MCILSQASKNGAEGVELDLEFTSDGVPILMHDETVDRTTNGSGPLSQICFSELSKLDAAAKHRLRSGEALTIVQLSRPVEKKHSCPVEKA